MIYNFEQWRKAKMAFWTEEPSHFHRVSTDTWLAVRKFLSCLLLTRIDSHSPHFSLYLDDITANALIDFINQMRWGYIHPRSTSARIDFLSEGGKIIC